jgi:pyrimidine-nucleoside phosphorylase
MISGRGLGFSGGTLDKLEAIPGFRVQLGDEKAETVLREVGCFIIAASENLVPADRKLYALRDVTGTVESVALITASILSKKLAANLDALVMDVKVGSAAFMKNIPDAQRLARSIQQTSVALGTPCRALITEMYQPLGCAVGNSLEVNEAVEVLKGEGAHDSVRELTLRLCAEALLACGLQPDLNTAKNLLVSLLQDGSAYARFIRLIEAQGGHWNDQPLPVAPAVIVTAPRSGYVSAMNGFALGTAVIELGGGRRVMTDQLDPRVGLSMLVRIGDHVEAGQPLCKVHADRQKGDAVCVKVSQAFTIVESPVNRLPLIYSEI